MIRFSSSEVKLTTHKLACLSCNRDQLAVIPLKYGSKNEIEEIAILCKSCLAAEKVDYKEYTELTALK